ncbi:hypothetical protein I7I49_20400 [Sinorhizobium meliloti]|uniref:hypothetical protein n=1 Tax=Rhizobium meliloti TaxID=382 RepID=UPI00237F77C8|nr:hypothetical protein [Sinorhizobium meliloti]MDE3812603.1 hypothetical protein [Sinorhizobium meliloti]
MFVDLDLTEAQAIFHEMNLPPRRLDVRRKRSSANGGENLAFVIMGQHGPALVAHGTAVAQTTAVRREKLGEGAARTSQV